ncbi:DMT family transporter [Streptomonospora salina]|uniref:Quaternary ammonium compound-resistance protein SugE n=1 Tax=Streptomonospora salina TaxID=104205 RepID=A0A841EI49_9ACTN|nr:multidrug efflux SMR transporter [Streptomonospora salina]MBB6001059.1 quaternary ammonium compound-resistance protein SugE [Streptomonospora salina]
MSPEVSAAWAVLVAAGLLETVWALALTRAQGCTRPLWAVAGIAVAALSLGLLSHALRTLPVGTAYAVWVGIGALSVAASGMVFLGEPVSRRRLACLGMIVAGVVGLSLAGDG